MTMDIKGFIDDKNNIKFSPIEKFDIIKGWTESGYANFNKPVVDNSNFNTKPLGEGDESSEENYEASEPSKTNYESDSEISLKSDKMSKRVRAFGTKAKKVEYKTIFHDEPFL